MARSRELVWTILVGLALMAGASQSQARVLGAAQVNIETRFVVVEDTFLRDIGVNFAHLVEKSTFGDEREYIELVVFGEFEADFRKRYKGTSSARVWCNNGQNLQSGRKSFKSQKGDNKHRFRRKVMMIPRRNCPGPIQIQIEVQFKGGPLDQFLQDLSDLEIEALINSQLSPTGQ